MFEGLGTIDYFVVIVLTLFKRAMHVPPLLIGHNLPFAQCTRLTYTGTGAQPATSEHALPNVNQPYDQAPQQPQSRALGCLSILGIILITMVVTVAGTLWLVNSRLFASQFKPVQLNESEQTVLSAKIDAIGLGAASDAGTTQAAEHSELQPEQYKEDDSRRRIELTERELNALLADNTDLAEQLVVDLADDVASVRLLIKLDPDFPFVGGKTLKVSSAASVSYAGNRPVVVLQGVSVWGVPLPNAWLGGLKNIDLVDEFGSADGFWTAFAEGIDDVRVEDGKLLLQLAE